MPRHIVDTAIPLSLQTSGWTWANWRWVVRNGLLYRRYCRFAYHLNRSPDERGQLVINERIDIGGEG